MPKNETALTIKEMQTEIDRNFADPSTLSSLMTITFNGLKPEVAKRAALEATMRGYTFRDFLEKNIYAIPYGDKYSLVSSIDFYRKVGMRNGVCGSSAPVFEIEKTAAQPKGEIISCTITIKRSLENGNIGEFTSTAYFSEYNTGRNLWISKPRTMLAKVAEMQALRKACPEELAQAYIEEEMPEAKIVAQSPAKIKKEEESEAVAKLKGLLKKTGKTETAFLAYVKKEKMSDLTAEEVEEWNFNLEVSIEEAKASKEVVAEAVAVGDGEIEYVDMSEEKTLMETVMSKLPDAEVIEDPRELSAKERLDERVNKLKNYKKQ